MASCKNAAFPPFLHSFCCPASSGSVRALGDQGVLPTRPSGVRVDLSFAGAHWGRWISKGKCARLNPIAEWGVHPLCHGLHSVQIIRTIHTEMKYNILTCMCIGYKSQTPNHKQLMLKWLSVRALRAQHLLQHRTRERACCCNP